MASEAIGVEVIVKMIRGTYETLASVRFLYPPSGSVNPRTSQQALLFIGSLARLVPEAVLHNVMPIFTYMGSSDFQRDDIHSFAVVEKVSGEYHYRNAASWYHFSDHRKYDSGHRSQHEG